MTEMKYYLNQLCEVLYKIDSIETFIRICPPEDEHGKWVYAIVNSKYLFDEPTEINTIIEKAEEIIKEKEDKLNKRIWDE